MERIEPILDEAKAAFAQFGSRRRAEELAECERQLAAKESLRSELMDYLPVVHSVWFPAAAAAAAGQQQHHPSSQRSAGSKRRADEISPCELADPSSTDRSHRLAALRSEEEALEDRIVDLEFEVELYEKGLLDELKKHGAAAWDRISPERNRWKKEVILAVFLSGCIPEVMFLERTWRLYAPKPIREDRDILLVRLSRDYALRSEDASSFSIPEPLCGDIEVVLAALRRIPECSTQRNFPKQLLDKVVETACESAEVTNSVRQLNDMLRDKKFLVRFFRVWPWKLEGPRWFRMLPEALKQDLQVIAAAFDGDCISFEELAFQDPMDLSFWIKIIQICPRLWNRLPDQFEHDPNFVVGFQDADMVDVVFRRFPSFASDLSIWKSVVNGGTADLFGLLRRFAPASIRGNYELMLSSCRKNGEVVQLLPLELLRDGVILNAAIEADPPTSVLEYIPKEIQVLHPDLTARAVLSLRHKTLLNHDFSQGLVAGSLWRNMNICKAWLEVFRRLPDCPQFPLSEMRENPEFGLLVAQYAHVDFKIATSDELRSDKPFMTQAVRYHSNLFRRARGKARRDFDVAVSACLDPEGAESILCEVGRILSDPNFPPPFQRFADSRMQAAYLAGYAKMKAAAREDLEFLRSVRAKAESKVLAHRGFRQAFVYGMTPFAGKNCNLTLLASDEATTSSLKQSIAAFLGVPATQELAKLRQVIDNLQTFPTAAHPGQGIQLEDDGSDGE